MIKIMLNGLEMHKPSSHKSVDIWLAHTLYTNVKLKLLTQTPRTVVKLNSEVVKVNNERKVQSTDSFFYYPKEVFRISCFVAKCWKIAFQLKVDRLISPER